MSGQAILIVDDEPDIREVVRDVLEDEGFLVSTAEGGEQARQLRKEQSFDLVLLDIWMPGTDGITLLKEWSEDETLRAPTIMISGHGNVETAVEAIRFGAYDFLEKPLSTAKLLVTVNRALQSEKLRRENVSLKERLQSTSDLVGKSEQIGRLKDLIARTAATDSWVLVTGEPGSGKGVAARMLHRLSKRAANQLVEISVAAIPGENLAVQLFGSEQGDRVQRGRFEEAHGGTLVLDQITDANLEVQARLLSALEDGAFVRVGGQRHIEMDVRIIATTNRDLPALVREGMFREDLFYRLNVVPIHMPPLREHIEDIPELTEFYLNWMVEKEQLPYRKFSTGALNAMRHYAWPGNVREFRNLIQRVLILNKEVDVTAEEMGDALGTNKRSKDSQWFSESVLDLPLREARDMFERSYLSQRLREVRGSVSELAPLVGMERTHLYRKLKSLDIDPKSIKKSNN
ncbi:sigma-54-dependent transcriptional regulator [Pseudomonadota bacterium]